MPQKKTASPLPGFPSTSWPGKLRMRYIVRKHKLLIKGLALEIGVSCPEVESISTFTRNKCSRLEQYNLNSQINWSVVSQQLGMSTTCEPQICFIIILSNATTDLVFMFTVVPHLHPEWQHVQLVLQGLHLHFHHEYLKKFQTQFKFIATDGKSTYAARISETYPAFRDRPD